MAYSAGFTPHPRISYAGAAPTGVASEAEYLEIGLQASAADLNELLERLNAALPEGVDVLEAVEASAGGLAGRLEASLWRVDFADLTGSDLQPLVDGSELPIVLAHVVPIGWRWTWWEEASP